MFLTVRRHAGNSRPGTGSVVRCEWRFQFSLIRENQCGGREHVITLKSDNSSVWLSHDCSQSCAHRCSELWYAPSPDSQHVPALAESRCHHYAPATPPARPENAPACDVRTIVELGKAIDFDARTAIPFEGERHNALDDARYQAKYVSVIWQKLIPSQADF